MERCKKVEAHFVLNFYILSTSILREATLSIVKLLLSNLKKGESLFEVLMDYLPAFFDVHLEKNNKGKIRSVQSNVRNYFTSCTHCLIISVTRSSHMTEKGEPK